MLHGSVILPIVFLLWPLMGALIPAQTSVVKFKKTAVFFLSTFLKVRKKKKSIAKDILFSLTGQLPQCNALVKKEDWSLMLNVKQ